MLESVLFATLATGKDTTVRFYSYVTAVKKYKLIVGWFKMAK